MTASAYLVLPMWLLLVAAADPATAADQKELRNDSAEIAFRLRFGNDVATVKRTRSKQDDALLAGRFLHIAKDAKSPQALTIRLYEKAYGFGKLHPDGYAYALEALESLVDLLPDRSIEWRFKIIHVQELRHKHGAKGALDSEQIIDLYMQIGNEFLAVDEPTEALQAYGRAAKVATKSKSPHRAAITRRLREARVLSTRRRALAQLKAAWAAVPEDRDLAAKLLNVYLYEIDRPAEALAYARVLGDPQLIVHVEWASKDLSKLSREQLIQLAHWYGNRGSDEQAPNRVAMYIRARMYYEQFLGVYATQDEVRNDAEAAMAQVTKDLFELGVGLKLSRRMVMKLRGDRGVAARDPVIQKAIDRGVAWLERQYAEGSYWDDPDFNPDQPHQRGGDYYIYGGYTSLVIYAMLMADQDPRSNRNLRKAINWMFDMKSISSYMLCYRAHAWEVLPNPQVHKNRMHKDAQLIVRNQCPDGTFEYSVSRRAPAGDLSTTLSAFLALWLAESGGIRIPPTPWQRVTDFLVDTQKPEGGWSYRPDRESATHGMTAAGLTILLMAMDHLEGDQLERARSSLRVGTEWLDGNFTVDPNRASYFFYYLATVQHVGLLANRRMFNDLDWYKAGAQKLIEIQHDDGSWASQDPRSIWETAFAVVFLARGGMHFESQMEQQGRITSGSAGP